MTSQSAVDALLRSRQADSEAKKQAVLNAIERLIEAGAVITVSAVAKAAKVSRPFIYNHDNLLGSVEKAKSSRPSVTSPAKADPERGWRAERAMLLAKIERQTASITELKSKIEALEHLRQRALGARLQWQDQVAPEEHAELRLTCDRLTEDVQAQRRTIAEVQRLNDMLVADLAASREAHAEDMSANGVGHDDSVVPIRSATRPQH